jgi:hypothetical protein
VPGQVEHDAEVAAYRQLRATIDAAHVVGTFVAIAGGQVVGAAADFHTLERTLRGRHIDPRNALVVQAGVEHPDYLTIFV